MNENTLNDLNTILAQLTTALAYLGRIARERNIPDTDTAFAVCAANLLQAGDSLREIIDSAS